MRTHGGRDRWIGLWFLLDGVIALAPPLYWWADGRTVPALGLPAALVYFLGVDLFIAASVVVAHLSRPARERR